jgi:hypothetical protein
MRSTRLSASAAVLNAVSDELSKPIAQIDAALKALNLGVTAWVEFAGQIDHNAGQFWDRSIGYTKVSGKWGIAISTSSGSFGDEPDEELWLFGDAPRSYRLEAVDKLPELIEKLVGAADETAVKLKDKSSRRLRSLARSRIRRPRSGMCTSPSSGRQSRASTTRSCRKHIYRNYEGPLGLSLPDLAPEAVRDHRAEPCLA